MAELRADRFATLYLFHPLRAVLGPRRAGIPILMYHSISRSDGGGRHPYYDTCTAAEVFEEHIRFLHDEGYQTIGLGEAADRIEGGSPAPGKPIVITFDDGFEDFRSGAFPILDRFGYTATVFLPTAYIGDTPQVFKETQCLAWSQVRELQAAGIEFGSHTVTHPQLRDLDFDSIKNEVRVSKEVIEQKLGCAVASFAYPYAFPETDHAFRSGLRQILAECGYQNGVSTVIGTANRFSDRLFLERLPVNSFDDLRFFRAKLEGGYDWLHTIQYSRKVLSFARP